MARLMVLGLLQMKPMTGYEMQQILQTSKTDLWAGVLPGSIYHALKKMEKEELVAIEAVEQTGHRTKAIYKITEKGSIAFRALISESLAESSVMLPSQLYTAISFIQHLPAEQAVLALKEQKAILEQGLQEQMMGIEKKREAMAKLDTLTELTAQNIFKQYELQIEFVQKLIAQYD